MLAGELSRTHDVAAAFAAYDRIMRPIVDRAQDIPKLMPRLLHPQTRLGLGLVRGALALAARPAVRRVMARFGRGGEGEALPEYGIAAE